jgi:indolepyruvate ferredoxin oxidoreductase
MSGVHALVRLPMLQQARDAAQGARTAGFISGYRGSPLGTYDQALWDAAEHLKRHDIVFQPGVNEELAASAVWGSQQLEFDPSRRRFDGVFGIWYGKGPGVDRSLDALKHSNLGGTAPLGGVIAVAGDDHVSKSSTLAHQSDPTLIAAGIPVFAPADVQDILDLGLHAFAMSRYSGLWAGMKTVQEVVESASAVDVGIDRVKIARPDPVRAAGGVHIRWPDDPLAQEARMVEVKWPAALAYVRANSLNRNVISGPADRFGIYAVGKAFGDTMQALRELGLDEAACRSLGIRVHKVTVAWPLEPRTLREFAAGLREVLVVEEKRPILEQQVREELYHLPDALRPRVVGKAPAEGEAGSAIAAGASLLRATADLTPALVASAIARRLKALGVPADVAAAMDARLASFDALHAAQRARTKAEERKPWFCPGCPHNTSTVVPEGSRAMAGIGCHGMVVWMDRNATSWTQMGGEGTPWVGQAPFTTERHIFANLGDGTYNHSGLLAIRQAIAARASITYKILYNGAVAMTGGQPVDGGMSVPAMTRELEAEGVRRIFIVSDTPEVFEGDAGLAPGVIVRHRDELEDVQKLLREVEGVTALIYAQECATKKRRERKRGKRQESATRVVINELVCEGCGDCSTQSNCMAVRPVETGFGRKRRVDQGTCNTDLSCLKGFCPSFVTIEGGKLKAVAAAAQEAVAGPRVQEPLQDPRIPQIETVWGIVVAGVGGTGVVTIGQVLGMAAHLEGLEVVTQDATGMAQMGGATWSHVQIARGASRITATRVPALNADLVLGCDPVVAASDATLSVLDAGRSTVVLNTHVTPTSGFIRNADWKSPADECASRIEGALSAGRLHRVDADAQARSLVGNAVFGNMLLLGYAWQLGRVPLSHASIERAIELNGVQVQKNKDAFEAGRRCATQPDARPAASVQPMHFVKPNDIETRIAQRHEFLSAYQDRAWADAYRAFVDSVKQAESAIGGSRLTEAVVRNLFKLMAYKDEYEVARLHTGAAFRSQLEAMFEGGYKVVHHLAPPLFSPRNARGELQKRPFGPWVRGAMQVLARLKFLRGSAFDPFGYTEERRIERRLIAEYRECIAALLPRLAKDNIGLAVKIASVPDAIRGFGHVKERNLASARAEWESLMAQWRAALPKP